MIDKEIKDKIEQAIKKGERVEIIPTKQGIKAYRLTRKEIK